jgi:hypothetical protein
VKDDRYTCLGNMPRRLSTGEAATNNVNMFHWALIHDPQIGCSGPSGNIEFHDVLVYDKVGPFAPENHSCKHNQLLMILLLLFPTAL